MMVVKDLDFRYNGSFQILRDIAFEALPGECLAVLGNNGAGKSTMLKCLNRILSPQKGVVCVAGNNMLHRPLGEVARNMAFVAQGQQASRLTVYDMVMLGRKPYIKWGVRKEDEDVVEDVLRQMDLTEIAARFVEELSGGEGQKVMLARALAQRPKVLLLDEPTSSLDLRNQHQALARITRVCRENQIAVVLVIHDLNLALRYCHKFMLIRENRVYAYGGAEVVTEEAVAEVYGIPARIHTIDGRRVVVPE